MCFEDVRFYQFKTPKNLIIEINLNERKLNKDSVAIKQERQIRINDTLVNDYVNPQIVQYIINILCIISSYWQRLHLQDSSKRLGANLGILSIGRAGITGIGATNLKLLITIAIRYSAVRRQFGPDDSSVECAIIEYQTQVWVFAEDF